MPTFLWGKSGHLQTATYAKVGRFNAPRPEGERFSYIMPDEATCTFDVFEPAASHPSGGISPLKGLLDIIISCFSVTFAPVADGAQSVQIDLRGSFLLESDMFINGVSCTKLKFWSC